MTIRDGRASWRTTPQDGIGLAALLRMLTLARFLRAAKATILQEWEHRVRSLPAASRLPGPVLLDHFPEIIENLADAVSRYDETPKPLREIPVVHAAERLRVGYDLHQVVAEYRVLRDVITEQYAGEAPDPAENAQSRIHQVRIMSEALDRAIADAVDRYAAERDRSREIFVSMLGHDLRAPLNAISMASQLLLRGGERLDARDLKRGDGWGAGSRSAGLRPPRPRDSLPGHGGLVEIEVRNRGTVSEDARSGMFEAFVTRTARASEHNGLGLGLYIVREIARAHGGDVRFECDDAETAFTLVLPRHAAPS